MKNNKLLPKICVFLGYVTCPVERGQTESRSCLLEPMAVPGDRNEGTASQMCSDLPKATCL